MQILQRPGRTAIVVGVATAVFQLVYMHAVSRFPRNDYLIYHTIYWPWRVVAAPSEILWRLLGDPQLYFGNGVWIQVVFCSIFWTAFGYITATGFRRMTA